MMTVLAHVDRRARRRLAIVFVVFLAFAMIMAVGAATGGPYDLLEPLSPWWQLVAGGSALAYALGRLAPALLRTYRTLVLVSADEDEVTLLTRLGLVHLRRGSTQNVTLRPVGRTHAVLVVERNGTAHELAIEAEGLTAAELAEIRHRIHGPDGDILHETFRPYAKFGAP